MGSHTARLPSWARSLSAFAAQGDEDMAGLQGRAPVVTPEEAYGFHRVGGGVPGRIHGTTRQQDFSSLRAFRARSSPGALTSDDVNNRVDARAMGNQAARYGMWENLLRQVTNQPQTFFDGETRRGGDGQMWRYNATTGKGEHVGAGAAPVDNWTGKPSNPAAVAAPSAAPKAPVFDTTLPRLPAGMTNEAPAPPRPASTFYTPDGRPVLFDDWKNQALGKTPAPAAKAATAGAVAPPPAPAPVPVAGLSVGAPKTAENPYGLSPEDLMRAKTMSASAASLRTAMHPDLNFDEP